MVSASIRLMQPGERANSEGYRVTNHLLLATPDNEFRVLRSRLKFLKLPHHTVLHRPKSKISYLYFLNEGMISLVVKCADRRSVEVAVVGREGVGGVPAVLTLRVNPLQEIMQISGEGFRIESASLQECLRFTPHMHAMLNRYAVLQTMQIAQTAACNRLHEIRQRLARWLLMTQDRVGGEYIPITHDFLASMLGTDRPSVTLAALLLQKKGAIQYVRRAVRIVSRKTLRRNACECYSAMEQIYLDAGPV